MGSAFIFVIIALVWGPLVLFALGNKVGAPNTPTEISLELRIGPYEPVYRMSAQSSHIHTYMRKILVKLFIFLIIFFFLLKLQRRKLGCIAETVLERSNGPDVYVEL